MVISARTWPSPGVSISSARQATGSSPNSSVSPRTRLCQRPKRAPRPRPGCRACSLRRGGAREHRPALAVEVAGQDVHHVDQPAGQGAELLRAGPDASVDGGGRCRRELAGHAPQLGRRDAAGLAHRLRREAAAASSRNPRPAPSASSVAARRGDEASSNSVATMAISSRASVPGRMKWCSSGLGGAAAARGR